MRELILKLLGVTSTSNVKDVATYNAIKQLSDNVDAISTPFALPYKVYTALLSQADTNPPTAIVLENTLGFDITWSRVGAGGYAIAKTFDPEKTAILITPRIGIVGKYYYGSNYLLITTAPSPTGIYADGSAGSEFLLYSTIEIRIYN